MTSFRRPGLITSVVLLLYLAACASSSPPLTFNHVYTTNIEPDVIAEIITSDGIPLEYYLVFTGRSELTEEELEIAAGFLQVIQPDFGFGEEIGVFILENAGRPVNRICQAESIPFGEWRLYAARYDHPLLLIARNCPEG